MKPKVNLIFPKAKLQKRGIFGVHMSDHMMEKRKSDREEREAKEWYHNKPGPVWVATQELHRI